MTSTLQGFCKFGFRQHPSSHAVLAVLEPTSPHVGFYHSVLYILPFLTTLSLLLITLYLVVSLSLTTSLGPGCLDLQIPFIHAGLSYCNLHHTSHHNFLLKKSQGINSLQTSWLQAGLGGEAEIQNLELSVKGRVNRCTDSQ